MSDSWYEDWLLAKEKPKCTCGATITMGKDDHWQFHSDYCEIYKEGKKDADVQEKK
jgi:hypothetical protein